jgi:SAM-dependent methyltransferase
VTHQSELLGLQETLYSSKNPTRRWLHCTRRDWIIEKIRTCARQNAGRALEVGFGSGVYLPVLAALYKEVFATDLQEIFVDHAKLLSSTCPNVHAMTDDITHSQLPANSFDLVLCSEVIEHIADSQKAISEIGRLLKPHGILILSTPQPLSPLELTAKIAFLPGVIELVRLVYKEPVLETGHINLMSGNTIASQLRAAGLSVREQFKSGVYLPLIAEFLREPGLRLERWLESKVRGGRLDALLWVQYYVAEKVSR